MTVSTDQLSGGASADVTRTADNYADLLRLSPVPMVLCDRAGKIALINIEAATLFSAPGEAGLVGQSFDRFFSPTAVSRYNGMVRALALAGERTAAQTAQLSCVEPGGRTFQVEASIKPAIWDGQSATIWALTDLTPISDVLDQKNTDLTRLVDAVGSISEGFAVFGPDGTLLSFNENYRRKTWPLLSDYIRVGLSIEDIIRETIHRNVWGPTGLNVEELVSEALARHAKVPSVHEINYPDGRCIRQSKRPTADGGIVAVYSDITDLRRREARIEEAQERHRRLLETLPDGVTILSGGKFAYVNPAAIRILGARTHTDLVGRAAVDLVPPEKRAEFLAVIEGVMNERRSAEPTEQRRLRLDGRIIQVELRHTYILWNAKPAVLTVVRDLTEQKRSEHVLQETEERYLSIASNLPGAVYQRVLHPDGSVSYPYLSRGVIETHGLEADQVRRSGSLLLRAIHPDDRERFSAALQESAEGLTAFDIEVRNIRPDGRVVWVRSVARTRRRDDGAIVWDGIFVDITARKFAEARAAQTYQWLTDAINALSEGFVLWDDNDRLVLWNEKFLQFHPQREELAKTGVSFEVVIDRATENFRSAFGDAVAMKWRAERIRRFKEASGSYEMQTSTNRWMMLTERKTREGYTVGVYSDITERKRAEEELRESEERYRRVVELSPDAIVVHLQGDIVYVNDTAAKIFGAPSADDLVGRNILDLVIPDDHISVLNRRNRIDEGDSSVFTRFRYRCLDGTVRHCESALSQFVWKGEDAYLVIVRDIEDRVAAERQQAIFTAVLHQAPDAIEIASPEFMVRYVNPAHEKMTGYEAGEVVGESTGVSRSLLPAGSEPPGVRRDKLESGQVWSGILSASRKDGSSYQQEATISPVFGSDGTIESFVAIKRDITERMNTEHALRESEERYRKLLSLSPDAVYVHVDSRIVLANEAAVRVFGAVDEADFLGRSIMDLIHPDYLPIVSENQKRAIEEGVETLRLDQLRLRVDGSEFWANVSITPLNWQGERGSLVIARDISEQRRAEEDLLHAMEATEIANRSKSEFLANMSHELRTPLNAIIGFSEIMRSEMFGPVGDGKYVEYVHNIHESGLHLLAVINDILDLSKVEAGKLTPHLTTVGLTETVENSVRMFDRMAEGAGVSIETLLPSNLPEMVVDQRMLNQMLMNLLSNAIKFTPTGGRVRLKVLGPHFGAVEIAVIDNGIGIRREDIDRILEPFVQMESALEKKNRGTGLGLPLTRSLAELHGGHFRIWSRVGLGTICILRLPLAPPREIAPEATEDA